MKKILFAFASVFLLTNSIFAQSENSTQLPAATKRGICYNKFTEGEVEMLKDSRVTWGYNWYQFPKERGEDPTTVIEYMPMIWGAGTDFDDMINRAREYLGTHGKTKVLLGFNEPEMKGKYGGCDLTPKEAAKKWPILEQLAQYYGVELASPALTWGFEKLSDGKVYVTPESWMDAFIKEYKKMNKKREPRFDYLVLHSYMDYPSAVMWFCDKYAEMYGKKVLLTEFCAWDSDQSQTPHTNAYEQMVTMSQKVEAMDNDPNVAAYAWFMSHAETEKIPFNSVFTSPGSNGSLTDLGRVYLFMSDCDNSKKFKTGEIIPASEYISSSNYNMTVGTKPEDGERFTTPVGLTSATDNSSKEIFDSIPLELGTFTNKRFANYKIEFESDGIYSFNLRIQTNGEEIYQIFCDEELIAEETVPSTNENWTTVKLGAKVSAGLHTIKVYTMGNAEKAKFYYLSVTKGNEKTTKISTPVKKIPEPLDPAEIAKKRFFRNFPGCGNQIWQDEWGKHDFTFAFDYDTGTITVGSVGWWGGAFGCYENGTLNGAKIDLSNVSKVTFDAKATSYGSIYLNFNDFNKNQVDLTKEFKEYSLEVHGLSSKAETLFIVGGLRDLNDPGTEVTIRNIAFWDYEGNEIIPQYK